MYPSPSLSLSQSLRPPPHKYVCACVCLRVSVCACVVLSPFFPCALCLRKGLIKERVSVSEQLMRFSPMSCEVFRCARVHMRVCLRVCTRTPVEDAVNWLRLTFSRGIVKGTVPPHLKRAICGARRRVHLPHRVLFPGNDESVAPLTERKMVMIILEI